jgi:Na+-driven multidrug efflux pump
VPLACALTFGLDTGVVAVWYVIVLDHLARTLWLAWSFRRGRWRGARA